MSKFSYERISLKSLVHLIGMFCFLFIFSGYSAAQREVMSFNKKDEIYLGQWYVWNRLVNTIFLIDKPKEADMKLIQLLEEVDLKLEDGKFNRDSSELCFICYTDLGFEKTIVRTETDDMVILMISINENVVKKEIDKPWYSILAEIGKFWHKKNLYSTDHSF